MVVTGYFLHSGVLSAAGVVIIVYYECCVLQVMLFVSYALSALCIVSVVYCQRCVLSAVLYCWHLVLLVVYKDGAVHYHCYVNNRILPSVVYC